MKIEEIYMLNIFYTNILSDYFYDDQRMPKAAFPCLYIKENSLIDKPCPWAKPKAQLHLCCTPKIFDYVE
jgi:hypothetical protein